MDVLCRRTEQAEFLPLIWAESITSALIFYTYQHTFMKTSPHGHKYWRRRGVASAYSINSVRKWKHRTGTQTVRQRDIYGPRSSLLQLMFTLVTAEVTQPQRLEYLTFTIRVLSVASPPPLLFYLSSSSSAVSYCASHSSSHCFLLRAPFILLTGQLTFWFHISFVIYLFIFYLSFWLDCMYFFLSSFNNDL